MFMFNIKHVKNIIYIYLSGMCRYTNMIWKPWLYGYIDIIWWLWPKPIILIAKENCLICSNANKIDDIYEYAHENLSLFDCLVIKDNKFLFLMCNKISWFVIDQRKSNQMICHNSTHLHTLWQSKIHKSVELLPLSVFYCHVIISSQKIVCSIIVELSQSI